MAEIATSLATGLLEGIAGKVGALIFDKVFPPGVPSYFDQVYNEIKKIVQQELAQNTINEVDGEVNGLKDWVKNTYTPRREIQPPVPPKNLFDLISGKEGDLTVAVIGILQEKSYAEAGLSVFMIAAGMHLAVLQELAYVDPHASDPQKSSYVQSIKSYAQQYADYAIKTYNSVEEKRIAYVHETSPAIVAYPLDPSTPPPWVPFSPGTVTRLTYSWVDEYSKEGLQYNTNVIGGKWTPLSEGEIKEQLSKAMQEHIGKVKAKLTKDLYDPKGTAAKWRELVEQPLVKL